MGLAPSADAFFSRVSPSLSETDCDRLGAAWKLAQAAHSGQLRQSGEPYVTHPLAVAELLLDLIEPDADALCAALLHDVVEDSATSLSSIKISFGARVANIVDGVSKLDRVGDASAHSAKEDTLRKLVAAGGRDWRVFAVKLCDRLHNMRTLNAVSAEKRRRVAAETYSVFFPLARYVGFHRVATELEYWSLRSLFPGRWRVVEKWCRYKATIDWYRLRDVFENTEAFGVGSGAVESSRVVHETMVRGFRRLREDRACRALFSIPTIFRCCESIADAYQHVSKLHSDFLFVPASFVSDATDGFLSTKVLLGRRGLVVDCVFLFPRVARAPWVREVGENSSADDFVAVASAADQPGGFTRVLRELVEHTAISVFSPKGRRLSLPRHASGLDFAFAIHTELGLRTQAVRVNGVLRDPITELAAGDIVEVIPSESVLARPEWHSALRSPRSRAKLRSWLRGIARQEAVELGRRLLSEAARMADAELEAGMIRNGDLIQDLGASNLEELWHRIGTGQVSAYAATAALQGAEGSALITGTSGLDSRSRLTLDGRTQKGVAYCDMCKPFTGDEIVAVSSFSGATIHRAGCVKKREGRSSNESFVPAWANRLVQPLPVRIAVESLDRKGLLTDCARVITECDLNVIAVNTLSRDDGTLATLEFTLLVRSRTKLERCLRELTDIAGVKSVGRPVEPLN